MNGKVVIVTGANSGLGLATVEDLYQRGAKCYMLCRSLKRGQEAIDKMKSEGKLIQLTLLQLWLTPQSRSKNSSNTTQNCRSVLRTYLENKVKHKIDGRTFPDQLMREKGRGLFRFWGVHIDTKRLLLRTCDLNSFTSVRQFVKDFMKEEDHVDVLVNNAGIMASDKYELSVDGHELAWQSNYLGHFLLTELLLTMLEKAESGRIVIVSSVWYSWCSLPRPLSAIDNEEEWGHYLPYARSKLANVLHCCNLKERLQKRGITNVTVNSCCPGPVKTNIQSQIPGILGCLLHPFIVCCFPSPEQGAQTQIFLASSAKVEGVSGKFFQKCKQSNYKRNVDRTHLAQLLYEYSMNACGLEPIE